MQKPARIDIHKSGRGEGTFQYSVTMGKRGDMHRLVITGKDKEALKREVEDFIRDPVAYREARKNNDQA